MSRIEKINQQVKREIGKIILQELSDPRLQMITITNVEVSRDLHNAKIYYSVLGMHEQIQAAHNGLVSAKGMIRRMLGESLNLRYTPDLLFIYDQSIEHSARIEKTLKEIDDEHQQSH